MMRMRVRLCAVLVSFALAGLWSTAATAQGLPGTASVDRDAAADAENVDIEPPSPNDIRELSRLLTDPRVARWLQEQAAEGDADALAQDAGLSPQEWLRQRLATVESHVSHSVQAWSDVSGVHGRFATNWKSAMGDGDSLRSLVYVIVFVVIGAGLEWLYWRYAWRTRRRIERQAQADVQVHAERRWGPVLLRAILHVVGIALFVAGTLAAFLAFEWPRLVELMVLGLLLAVVSVRIIDTVAVFVLCPRVPALRPVPLATPAARLLYRWVMVIASVACIGGFSTLALEEMALADGMSRIVMTVTGTLVAMLLLLALRRWRLQQRGTGVASDAASTGRDMEFVVAGTVIAVTWVLWMAGAYSLMWTAIILATLVLADRACKHLLGPHLDGSDGDDTGKHLYRPVLERFVRFIAVLAAILAAGAAWGIDWWQLSASSSVAGRIASAAADLLVAALIADLVWTWARTAIDARMANYEPPTAGQAPGPEARLATLLPLLRTILLITLIVMLALIGLSSLGVNIGPLLASAGVVGIAVGFGAQTLVRDIVSGIFFLLDDAFRVGEYIEVEQLRGTVESISVRSLRLRHHRGAVHTIPFGEMKSLTNHSRDWVIVKLEFRVPFDTDLKLVKKLIKQIGAELAANDELGPKFIEPLKSQGVRRMEEFNMVVGVKFMSRPGEQWVIRRETYQRVRDAFDANGIKLAERNVKVEVVGGQDLSDGEREAVLGAAQDAVEQRLPLPSGAPAT